jgi:flagellar motility protein MotE (MotC chaperone)
MLKYLAIIIGCVCVTVVLSEVTVGVILWQRGTLTEEQIREIRMVLTHGSLDDREDADHTPAEQVPTMQDVADARALKVLNYDKRESELATLKDVADQKRNELDLLQSQFRAQRKAFEEELQKLDEAVSSSATEQTRGVLLALPPKEAVRQLMQLTLEEDVALLRGMPEKAIAKILKEFPPPPATASTGSTAPDSQESRAERGRKIFEALSRGEPRKSLIEQARSGLEPDPAQVAE